VILIRDTEPDQDNPLTYEDRVANIQSYFKARAELDRVHFIRLPDPGCDLVVQIGRNVGYEVKRFSPELESISGTKERARMRQDGRL
jgi:hypothetical protein